MTSTSLRTFGCTWGGGLLLVLVGQCPAVEVQSFIISNVTVIDATEGPARPNRDVVVVGNRIKEIAEHRVGKVRSGHKLIDGKDRFLIPGLWDMHVHLSWTKMSAMPLLVANGVTGVRDCGGLLSELDDWRSRVEAGNMVGPRIIRSGPVLNGKKFAFQQIAVGNSAEARGAVRALHNAGVDFIKVHRAISHDAYSGVAEECKRLGIAFVGHVPNTVTPLEASNAGQASIEHVGTLFDGTFASEFESNLKAEMERFTRESAHVMFASFAKNGTAFTPTLVSHRMVTQFGRRKENPLDKYVSSSAKKLAAELEERDRSELTPEFYQTMEHQYKISFEVVRLMKKAGVRLLAGTDIAIAGTYPGFDLHEELALLVEAGLSPKEALQTATRNAADFLKLDDLGTIQVGKLADLVLLDADPLLEIRNTKRIHLVVINGVPHNRTELDAMLRIGEQLASEN